MIHAIEIDGNIADRIAEFNVRFPDEKIVQIRTTENYLFVVTEKPQSSQSFQQRNLLLEELKTRGIKP